jgi:hypothetical protein
MQKLVTHQSVYELLDVSARVEDMGSPETAERGVQRAIAYALLLVAQELAGVRKALEKSGEFPDVNSR